MEIDGRTTTWKPVKNTLANRCRSDKKLSLVPILSSSTSEVAHFSPRGTRYIFFFFSLTAKWQIEIFATKNHASVSFQSATTASHLHLALAELETNSCFSGPLLRRFSLPLEVAVSYPDHESLLLMQSPYWMFGKCFGHAIFKFKGRLGFASLLKINSNYAFETEK